MYKITTKHVDKQTHTGKETIHSGHFMVSHFEAEAQDDYDDLAVPVPDEEQMSQKVSVVATYTVPVSLTQRLPSNKQDNKQQLSIEVSLTKLFKCMNLAYRQKLTSPKWNRFKGIKLRWKDKIRLNNVIWRCWHMQFIKKQNTLSVCQFASPLDVDTHVKPETILLEGKYWKRRAEAVIAEYKKWRMFHITRLFGKGDISVQDMTSEMDVECFAQGDDFANNMLTDEDYLNFMSDTLFTTISNHQPFAFPDTREIARGASLADFIQPSLGPLQPNLEEFMDTFEPLQDLLCMPRLPPVPEESTLPPEESLYNRGMPVSSFSQQGYIPTSQQPIVAATPVHNMSMHGTVNNTQLMMSDQSVKNERMGLYDNSRLYSQNDLHNNMIHNQEMIIQEPYPSGSYEQTNTQTEQLQTPYSKIRNQYVNTPKIITQSDGHYPKYNTAVPPSQTAPETVSLLQQPVQNAKYGSSVVIQGRSGYSREKPRARMSFHSSHSGYQGYGQSNQQVFERPQRTSPQQLQYLQPVDQYKQKQVPAVVNSRPFKMPSPPLPPIATQQTGSIPVSQVRGAQEQFRSHSLPLGAQLNADWSVSAPAVSAVSAVSVAPAHETSPRHVARAREPNLTSSRLRSRSTSSSVVGERSGSSAGGPRRPPPLNSVASEPSLPQTSIMLAQLLSAQHSQSLYKLNNTEESPKSPARRVQPSPIGSDIMSPHASLSPPMSPTSPSAGSPRDPRRTHTHLHAEQKRRYNIKNGFDTLQALIPHLNSNPSAKISKAAMLQKGAEYIKQLKMERNQIKEEMENLRQQIECLNNSISNCHSLLPATGAPVSRARAGRLREMFARHVADRTQHCWKYWLLSVVGAGLVESFSSCVSAGSGAELVRTTLLWTDQHCSLAEMRPAVLNSLRVLCTTTDMLTSPERLPEEARAAAAASAGVKLEPT